MTDFVRELQNAFCTLDIHTLQEWIVSSGNLWTIMYVDIRALVHRPHFLLNLIEIFAKRETDEGGGGQLTKIRELRPEFTIGPSDRQTGTYVPTTAAIIPFVNRGNNIVYLVNTVFYAQYKIRLQSPGVICISTSPLPRQVATETLELHYSQSSLAGIVPARTRRIVTPSFIQTRTSKTLRNITGGSRASRQTPDASDFNVFIVVTSVHLFLLRCALFRNRLQIKKRRLSYSVHNKPTIIHDASTFCTDHENFPQTLVSIEIVGVFVGEVSR